MGEFESLTNSLGSDESPSKAFLEDWSTHCLLTGKQVTLQTGSTQVVGTCLGIDSQGALMLETEIGQQRFFGGVVQSWR